MQNEFFQLKRVLSPLIFLFIIPILILQMTLSGSVLSQAPQKINAPLDLSLELFAEGFSLPTSMTNSGVVEDGRLFVTQQGGQIRIIDASGNHRPTPFLDITPKVSLYGENGLLGLAFDPDYSNNGYFYIYYTQRDTRHNHLARYQVNPTNPNQALSNSETILMIIEQPKDGHNGGGLAFGPDNYLYIGVGDGGLQPKTNPTTKPQELNSLLGKILRIDVRETAVNQPDCGTAHYTIPADNPFADGDGNQCDEIWAYGLRNPWRISFDRETGDLFIGDVGENEWEEINWQAADSAGGANYGWPCYEANAAYNTTYCDSHPIQHQTPIFAIPHGDPNSHCSVSGGYIYRGTKFPAMQGHYLLSDFCSGFIWSLNRQDNNWESYSYGDQTDFPVTFGEDIDGELYLAELLSGKIYHLVENTKLPSLAVTLTGPTANNGIDPIRYELTVTNNGNGDATNLTLTNVLPQGATFLKSNDGGSLAQNGVVYWNIPALSATSSITKSYEVQANETIRNYWYGVVADGGYTAVGQDEVITEILAPKLDIFKAAPNHLQPGELIPYTITLFNNGTITATNISITDTIPHLTTFASANNGGIHSERTVTWQVPSLAPNSYVQVQLIVNPITIFTDPTAIVNYLYGANAAGRYKTEGAPVVLIFNAQKTFLPIVQN